MVKNVLSSQVMLQDCFPKKLFYWYYEKIRQKRITWVCQDEHYINIVTMFYANLKKTFSKY